MHIIEIIYRIHYFIYEENKRHFIAPEGSFVASRSGDRTAKIIHQQRHLQMRLLGMISFPEQFFRYSRKSFFE